MLAQLSTTQNNIAGALADFVSVGASFESRAGTASVITLFVAFLRPFGNITGYNLYENNSFLPISPPFISNPSKVSLNFYFFIL